MLQTLLIKNFALIKEQTIEFKNGFNVLVGETGAGKSLILDALGFVLGDKSNKINIRNGENKMFVQAVFFIENNMQIASLLNEYDIEFENEIIFSRSFNIEGKNECRINGIIVPVSLIKEISSLIVDFYRQNENINLLNVKNHIKILDNYGGGFEDLKFNLKKLILSYDDICDQMKKIGGNKENRERELEFLQYQIQDIENANLKINEEEELKSEFQVYINSEKILENIKNSTFLLNDINDKLQQVKSNISISCKYDESLTQYLERINSTNIDLVDIEECLEEYISAFEFDEKRLNFIDERLEQIKLLKKKYGNSIEDVLTYLNKIKDDYDNLLFGEEKLIKLERQKDDIKKQILDVCESLSLKRKQTACLIENDVKSELLLLGFKNASFKVNFSYRDNDNFSYDGYDDVEFLLSANIGQNLKSMSKTISGGEMSRFMLALKNVFAKCFNTETLVFDEVDSGISGEIAQKVAERMANLAVKNQLICITHLCQVASMADHYIYVQKEVSSGQTFTNIKVLDNHDIIKYLAISSGAEPTEVALKFASELKLKADNFKNAL